MDSATLFGIALTAYGLSTFLYIGSLLFKKLKLEGVATFVIIAGACAQTIGLVIRTMKAGHAPFSNLYESMVFFSWTIVIFYLFIEYRYKLKIIGAFVSLIAFLAISYASMLSPQYKEITPLVPALQSYWLEIHVITCFLGYAAFTVAFVMSIMYLAKDRLSKIPELPTEDLLDELSYKIIAIGVVFLTLGIITGAIWANYAWGSYWSWDPKETWALITWLIYAIYLHARVTIGWRKKKAACLAIIGFAAVIFTYLGVNFLMAGLHSYL
ncbi:c-type cytochrome biogenesis protein CcsB [bacterium]|nr:c-type cytochrome biogenesis protein CcsB [bacterium]MBU1599851.1 c-type cytochrome biogenesis protein CcsB [bacterium]